MCMRNTLGWPTLCRDFQKVKNLYGIGHFSIPLTKIQLIISVPDYGHA